MTQTGKHLVSINNTNKVSERFRDFYVDKDQGNSR